MPNRRPVGLFRHGQLLPYLVCIAMLLAAASAQGATKHALIMWIGNYAEPSAKLKGIEKDALAARRMAGMLGVPPANIVELSNEKLNFQGMRSALRELTWRVSPGDEVFVYFSGHGARYSRAGQPGCQEGLVTHEGRLLVDAVLVAHLDEVALRAKRVVMMTDACHAAGVMNKAELRGWQDNAQTKAYPASLLPDLADAKAGPDGRPVDRCAIQVNRDKSLRSMAPSDRIIHLAAAAADEAAFTTPEGSLGTRAWAACLEKGVRTHARALAQCAQAWVNQQTPRRVQTIVPNRNPDWPLAD